MQPPRIKRRRNKKSRRRRRREEIVPEPQGSPQVSWHGSLAAGHPGLHGLQSQFDVALHAKYISFRHIPTRRDKAEGGGGRQGGGGTRTARVAAVGVARVELLRAICSTWITALRTAWIRATR